MDAIAPGLVLAPLDSARVVSTVYSLSLATAVPFLGVAAAAVTVRRMSAGTRAVVWRAAVVTLLLMALAQLAPVRWEAWVLPAVLADPLVALGRHAVRSGLAGGSPSTGYFEAGMPTAALGIALLGITYLGGVAVVLAAIVRGALAARRLVASAAPLEDRAWNAAATEVWRTLGSTRPVTLRVSTCCAVPLTVGAWRPVILIPLELLAIPPADRHAVLVHELSHIRAADVAYGLAAQLACALFWFHPGAWWIARRLRRDSEMACDDCVLGSGTRQSDYARLLVTVADRLHRRPGDRWDARVATATRASTPALTGHGDLRARLASITAVDLDRHAPRPTATMLALAAAVVVALPLGMMKLEPTRDVLHSLMTDGRWESRAWAALGLAPRSDSLAVTQHAAASDPSPHVRAWASYALSREAAGHRAAPAGTAPIR